MSSELQDSIEHCLWPNGYSRHVWMVVDAARDRRIFGLLLECFYSRHSCLFAGPIAPALEVVAPYLVQLSYDDKKTRKFIAHAWSRSWGIFLRCDAKLEILRRHLRTFLLVKDESGSRWMFRYYDPRILRVYLPTCTANELETVFGPIEHFLVEEQSPATLLQFSFDKKQLLTTAHPLAPPT